MTELHAFRPVGTAFEKTRKLLLEPFNIGTWIKLAIITFFVGTGTSLNPGNSLRYSFNQGDLSNLNYNFSHVLSDNVILALILIAVAVAIVLGLLLSYLRGVFSFILIDALTSGNVRIVKAFKENMGRGFKVFLFNVAVAIVSLIVVGAILVAMALAIFWATDNGNLLSGDGLNAISAAGLLVLIAAVILGLLAILVYAILIGLFVGFFYDFAVPLMFFKNMGLRQSVGEVWRLVRRQPFEFFAYVIVRWALEIAIAVVMIMLYLFVLAIFVAIAVVIAIALAAAVKTNMILAVLFALALLIGLLLLIIVSAFISMPIQAFLRYYSLDFLKSFDPSYVEYTGRMAQTGGVLS
jgi:hypothetical protein